MYKLFNYLYTAAIIHLPVPSSMYKYVTLKPCLIFTESHRDVVDFYLHLWTLFLLHAVCYFPVLYLKWDMEH